MRVWNHLQATVASSTRIISIDRSALMFRCKQLAEDIMSGCEHVSFIAGADVGMVFTAEQPILWDFVTQALGTDLSSEY